MVGFPPGKDVEVNLAIQKVLFRLDCCAGPYAPGIRAALASPSLVFTYADMEDCGMTFWPTRIALSRKAWNCCSNRGPNGLNSLASVILHELAHAAFYAPMETLPQYLERACFNCEV